MSEDKKDQAEKTEAQADDAAQAAGDSSLKTDVGYLGVKAGMTQIYREDGRALGVTVVELVPNKVTQVRTKEKDGYQAVQVGILDKPEKSVNKAEAGHAKKSGSKGFYHYQELRMPASADPATFSGSLGKNVSSEFLKEGDRVDLTAVSKGKGFQGVIKRYHFGGGPMSHGASVVHRVPGSIGSKDSSKVYKGRKMAGHMGHKKVTQEGVTIAHVDSEKGVLLVHGSVPGPRSGIVLIRKAVKGLGSRPAAEASR